MTPFGNDVDPDVYCKNAIVLGSIVSLFFFVLKRKKNCEVKQNRQERAPKKSLQHTRSKVKAFSSVVHLSVPCHLAGTSEKKELISATVLYSSVVKITLAPAS